MIVTCKIVTKIVRSYQNESNASMCVCARVYVHNFTSFKLLINQKGHTKHNTFTSLKIEQPSSHHPKVFVKIHIQNTRLKHKVQT